MSRVRVPEGVPSEQGESLQIECNRRSGCRYIVGVVNGEGPPVPIPNTEVKLTSAENTWLETAWEDRKMPTQFASLAQSVEHAAVNRRVVGSSPTVGAKERRHRMVSFFFA